MDLVSEFSRSIQEDRAEAELYRDQFPGDVAVAVVLKVAAVLEPMIAQYPKLTCAVFSCYPGFDIVVVGRNPHRRLSLKIGGQIPRLNFALWIDENLRVQTASPSMSARNLEELMAWVAGDESKQDRVD